MGVEVVVVVVVIVVVVVVTVAIVVVVQVALVAVVAEAVVVAAVEVLTWAVAAVAPAVATLVCSGVGNVSGGSISTCTATAAVAVAMVAAAEAQSDHDVVVQQHHGRSQVPLASSTLCPQAPRTRHRHGTLKQHRPIKLVERFKKRSATCGCMALKNAVQAKTQVSIMLDLSKVLPL
ncbi:MAG: hypothetical protein MJA30_29530 [Cytophagales bacterium]|nr:hypothetical protein [Cytophagales bacterium]